VIGGDSAECGLTLALIGRLMKLGEEFPACAWLISPWTDLTMSGASLDTRDAIDPDRRDPRVSPLYADLKGFPPLLIQVGSAETLLDDAVRLAAALGEDDVPVMLQIWPQMIHAWPLWNAHLDAGRRALASAGSFVRDHIS